jgi:hypothetical protein
MVFLLCTTFLFAAPTTTQQFYHPDKIRIGRLAAPAQQIVNDMRRDIPSSSPVIAP